MLYHVCSVDAATPAEHGVAARRCTQYAAPNARAPLASSNRHMHAGAARAFSPFRMCAATICEATSGVRTFKRPCTQSVLVFFGDDVSMLHIMDLVHEDEKLHCNAQAKRPRPRPNNETKRAARARQREVRSRVRVGHVSRARPDVARLCGSFSRKATRARRHAQGDTLARRR